MMILKYNFYRVLIISLTIVLFIIDIKAQNYSPPSGVYCSCGSTTGVGQGSVSPSVAVKPFVKGILVRIGWKLLEPYDQLYNWTLLDQQIAAANSYDKKISLGIGCGPAIPQWVFGLGAQSLKDVVRSDTIAVPWDNIFLSKWKDFIIALGNRYKNDTTITLVYMTNSTANGFEMQLPFNTNPSLIAAGYSDAKMISSWKQIIDVFDTAFPHHYLTNDFHPVNNSDAVADSVYLYAKKTIGNKYGASAWWWTQKNTTVYPDQYSILQSSANNNKFTGIQMAYNGTSDSTSFGAGGMPAALKLAIDNKICYWEIWNQDILNPKFDSLLNTVKCSVLTGMNYDQDEKINSIEIYPNPIKSILNIVLKTKPSIIIQIEIYDQFGKKVFNKMVINDSLEISLDVSFLPAGIYIIRLNDGYDLFTKKVVMQR